MPIKTLLIIATITSTLPAAVWSKTMMSIATGQLTPFVSSQMNSLTTKVTQINTKYTSDIEAKMLTKDTNTKEIRNLEKEILLELKEISFNQKHLNAAAVQE